MRIISGKLKGREVKGYQIEGTRPTMDRVKESIFSMIQEHILDSTVLDLFAGSGNLGLEAISNGAKKAYFVDKNKVATNTIQETGRKFQVLDQMEIITKDAIDALSYFEEKKITFDLVFLDPPYEDCIMVDILEALRKKHLLKKQAIVVCEMEENYIGRLELEGYQELKSRQYGRKYVTIYQFLI